MKLVTVLIVFVALYHVINLSQKSFFAPKQHWVRADLVVRRGPAATTVPLVSSWGKSPTYFDEVSKWISGLGYITRFWLGQIPDFVIRNHSTKPIEFFERKEIFTLAHEQQPLYVHAANMVNPVLRQWSARGVTAVFLPVPSKLSIERAGVALLPSCDVWRTCQSPKRDASQEIYETFVSRVPAAVDLYSRFKAVIVNGERPYLSDDSHWSSRGIGEAALAVLGRVRPAVRWTLERRELINGFHFGREVLQLPLSYLEHSESFSAPEPLFAIRERRPESGRLVVIGTSFCQRLAHTGYGLGNLLATALGRDLVQVCMAAGGMWGSFRKLSEDGVELATNDLVVWEAPMFGFN